MPRKPSSIFLITGTPSTQAPIGMPPTTYQCWRLPLTDDVTAEDLIAQHLHAQPLGTTMYVVEDTKVTAYEVALQLDEVDDARLPDPAPPTGPPFPPT